MSLSLIKKKLMISAKYTFNKSTSPFQAFLKSTLVPLNDFNKKLPKNGLILDLGCGEGILTNLVSTIRPNCKIIGIDLDKKKIFKAKKNSNRNCYFINGNIFDELNKFTNVSAIILNDVVHHINYENHQILISKCIKKLKPNGLFILKEVDKNDYLDYKMTKYFDEKLYPNDKLCFRSKSEWIDIFNRLRIKQLNSERFFHPWPASRTLFYAKKRGFLDPEINLKKISNLLKRKRNNFLNIFITGASGFLGQYLIENLLENGLNNKKVRIICLSRSPLRSIKNKKNIYNIFGDLDDDHVYSKILDNIDYIFHLAAEVKLNNGTDLWRNNFIGSKKLINQAEKYNVKRFIYASTIGAVDRSLDDQCTEPLKENDKEYPMSEYGLTKLKTEKYLKSSKLEYSILRITWAYGKNMTPDTHIRFLCDSNYKNKIFTKFCIPGKVSIVSAFDVAKAFCLIAIHKNAKNQIFYISDGKPISIGNLLRSFSSILNIKKKFFTFPKVCILFIKIFRRFLPLSIQALVFNILTASPKKIEKLGFKCSVNVRDGLRILAEDLGYYDNKNIKKSVSIITGAASGIGKSLAHKLSYLGHNLLLIDKNQKELKLLSSKLNSYFMVIDLNKENIYEKLSIFLKENNLDIDWLINNAGIANKGHFKNISKEKIKDMINVNCIKPIELTHFFLNSNSKVLYSKLLNIGSSAGFQPLPFMSIYSASKTLIQSFTHSVNIEEMKNNIFLVDPSGTDTNFQKNAGVAKRANENLLKPDYVAKKIIDVLEKNKKYEIIGLPGKLMYIFSKLTPLTLQINIMKKLMIKFR